MCQQNYFSFPCIELIPNIVGVFKIVPADASPKKRQSFVITISKFPELGVNEVFNFPLLKEVFNSSNNCYNIKKS